MARLQKKSRRQSPQVQPVTPAFPARWLDGLYVVSLVRRLSGHHRSEHVGPQDLDTSVGVSGHHDFAVRTVSFVGMTEVTLRGDTPTASRPPRS